MRKFVRCLEKWGHYLLAGVCAAVILLSALWTRTQQALDTPDSLVLSDQSQRLADGTPFPALASLARPVDGPVLTPYSDAPVYSAQTGVWQAHPWVDFSVPAGGAVYAMLPGEILFCDGDVTIRHENGVVSRYGGLGSVAVRAGQTVQAGQRIGAAGSQPPDPAETVTVSVCLLRAGVYAPFGLDWVDNSTK